MTGLGVPELAPQVQLRRPDDRQLELIARGRGEAGDFAVTRNEEAISAEAALDGIYVLRTSVPAEQMTTGDVVRAYKNLAHVERDFRSLKTIDLDLRPIHHHTETRVRAHVFLCTLAAYLTWHLRQALAPLTFTDEHPPERTDPVAPARRSPTADHKATTKTTTTGDEARGFRDLLDPPRHPHPQHRRDHHRRTRHPVRAAHPAHPHPATRCQEPRIAPGKQWGAAEVQTGRQFSGLSLVDVDGHHALFSFLALVPRLFSVLKAGYLEDWRWHATLSGSPQGGIASPVLSNIYLDRFDQYVEQRLLPEYNLGPLDRVLQDPIRPVGATAAAEATKPYPK
jgi:hypothetical protein